MKIECWLLAIVNAESGDEPWAEIHPTAAAALASVVNTYREHLSWHVEDGDERLLDEAAVADLLDGVATFTIEPAIIDTDELGSE